MHINQLHVENYRSLRNITFRPGALTVIIGPNGSGKSNLASAFEFVSDTYSNGLEYALLKKGGFENVAFRGKRRTKSAIKFVIDFTIEAKRHTPFIFPLPRNSKSLIRIVHTFAIKASSQSLRADYHVVEDKVSFYVAQKSSTQEGYEDWPHYLTLERENNEIISKYERDDIDKDFEQYLGFLRNSNRYLNAATELFSLQMLRMGYETPDGISVHQFSPQISRTPGAPTPNPKLTSYGENLAALVDWLKRQHPKRWDEIETSMQQIVPGLESIGVEFSPNKLLVLTFKDERSNRPWTSEEVSDGTIQTLAILCCLADPRISALFLEEPENSVHPWIVRQLARHFTKHSVKAQTIVTTHSPIILNAVSPEQVWVCFKEDGETFVSHLPELQPEIVDDWKSGQDRLYELLDMGLVSEAVPKGQLA